MEKLDFVFKKDRSFGDLFNDFIHLYKKIFKHFNITVLSISLQFVAVLMILSYFFITNIIEAIQYDTEDWLGFGVATVAFFLFGLALIITISMFSIEYMLLLEERRATDFDSKDVFRNIKAKFKKYVRFFLGAIVVWLIIIVPLILLLAISIFIPIVGNLVIGVIGAVVSLYFYMALLVYMKKDMGLKDSFLYVFRMINKKFFVYGLASYVMQFIIQIALGLITAIPLIILGFISFVIMDVNENFLLTSTGKFILTIGVGFLGLLIVFSTIYLISFYVLQYFSLIEHNVGEQTIEDIDQIGVDSIGKID